MKQKILLTILAIGIMDILVGCDSVKALKNTDADNAQMNGAYTVSENVESFKSEETKNLANEAESAEVQEETYICNKERDIIVLEHIDESDGTEIDLTNRVLDEKKYTLPESIDIYSYFGTYAGYTKPDIYVGSVSRVDGWVRICFGQSSFLAKAEDFDRVAVAEEETGPEMAVESMKTVVMSENSVQAEDKEIIESSTKQEPVIEESDKYKPEGAVDYCLA